MATVKKSAVSAEPKASAEEQAKVDILTGIVDRDTRTYTMQKTVTIGGQKREGTFKFRYPTLADRLRQGTMQARLVDGTSIDALDVVTFNLAFMMAYLSSVSVQLPPWFRFEDMESVDELQGMYAEVTAFVNSFRGNDAETADAAGGENTARQKALALG